MGKVRKWLSFLVALAMAVPVMQLPLGVTAEGEVWEQDIFENFNDPAMGMLVNANEDAWLSDGLVPDARFGYADANYAIVPRNGVLGAAAEADDYCMRWHTPNANTGNYIYFLPQLDAEVQWAAPGGDSGTATTEVTEGDAPGTINTWGSVEAAPGPGNLIEMSFDFAVGVNSSDPNNEIQFTMNAGGVGHPMEIIIDENGVITQVDSAKPWDTKLMVETPNLQVGNAWHTMTMLLYCDPDTQTSYARAYVDGNPLGTKPVELPYGDMEIELPNAGSMGTYTYDSLFAIMFRNYTSVPGAAHDLYFDNLRIGVANTAALEAAIAEAKAALEAADDSATEYGKMQLEAAIAEAFGMVNLYVSDVNGNAAGDGKISILPTREMLAAQVGILETAVDGLADEKPVVTTDGKDIFENFNDPSMAMLVDGDVDDHLPAGGVVPDARFGYAQGYYQLVPRNGVLGTTADADDYCMRWYPPGSMNDNYLYFLPQRDASVEWENPHDGSTGTATTEIREGDELGTVTTWGSRENAPEPGSLIEVSFDFAVKVNPDCIDGEIQFTMNAGGAGHPLEIIIDKDGVITQIDSAKPWDTKLMTEAPNLQVGNAWHTMTMLLYCDPDTQTSYARAYVDDVQVGSGLMELPYAGMENPLAGGMGTYIYDSLWGIMFRNKASGAFNDLYFDNLRIGVVESKTLEEAIVDAKSALESAPETAEQSAIDALEAEIVEAYGMVNRTASNLDGTAIDAEDISILASRSVMEKQIIALQAAVEALDNAPEPPPAPFEGGVISQTFDTEFEIPNNGDATSPWGYNAGDYTFVKSNTVLGRDADDSDMSLKWVFNPNKDQGDNNYLFFLPQHGTKTENADGTVNTWGEGGKVPAGNITQISFDYAVIPANRTEEQTPSGAIEFRINDGSLGHPLSMTIPQGVSGINRTTSTNPIAGRPDTVDTTVGGYVTEAGNRWHNMTVTLYHKPGPEGADGKPAGVSYATMYVDGLHTNSQYVMTSQYSGENTLPGAMGSYTYDSLWSINFRNNTSASYPDELYLDNLRIEVVEEDGVKQALEEADALLADAAAYQPNAVAGLKKAMAYAQSLLNRAWSDETGRLLDTPPSNVYDILEIVGNQNMFDYAQTWLETAIISCKAGMENVVPPVDENFDMLTTAGSNYAQLAAWAYAVAPADTMLVEADGLYGKKAEAGDYAMRWKSAAGAYLFYLPQKGLPGDWESGRNWGPQTFGPMTKVPAGETLETSFDFAIDGTGGITEFTWNADAEEHAVELQINPAEGKIAKISTRTEGLPDSADGRVDLPISIENPWDEVELNPDGEVTWHRLTVVTRHDAPDAGNGAQGNVYSRVYLDGKAISETGVGRYNGSYPLVDSMKPLGSLNGIDGGAGAWSNSGQ